ncbi:hypothetical protein ACFV42_46425 [Streptomyces solisilvae]|uniref:hypothetical protein n=1 Tax=Streptomyces malaysiensis TaxID=92644 RepID=UPI00368040AC
MPTPHADPWAERIHTAQARRIARSLSDQQAEQLRAVFENDLTSGSWDDMRINNALRRRGLLTYTISEHSYQCGGGAWKTRPFVSDARVTRPGRAVLEEWEILHAPGAYHGPELGTAQRHALECLTGNHGGRWWPGCGWSVKNRFETVRILDSLVARGLAERGATAAGDPIFTATGMGRLEVRPHWRKLLDVRAARKSRLEASGRTTETTWQSEPGHGCTWQSVREVDAMAALDVGDTFVRPGTAAYVVHRDGSVHPTGITRDAEMGGTAWTVRSRIGEAFTCESHTGQSRIEILRAGVRVLKVVPKREERPVTGIRPGDGTDYHGWGESGQ